MTPDEVAALAELEAAIEFASQPRSAERIAERLGTSRQNVQNAEIRALRALRRLMVGNDTRAADLERQST